MGVDVDDAHEGHALRAWLRRWPRVLTAVNGGGARVSANSAKEEVKGDAQRWKGSGMELGFSRREDRPRGVLEAPRRSGGTRRALGAPASCLGARGGRRQGSPGGLGSARRRWAL